MGKIVELESESEFQLVKKSLFEAAAKFSRGDFTKSALPSFCAAADYPPGFKKPEEEEEAKEGEDEGDTVTGDMLVSLVAKCPIQEFCCVKFRNFELSVLKVNRFIRLYNNQEPENMN